MEAKMMRRLTGKKEGAKLADLALIGAIGAHDVKVHFVGLD